MIAAPVFSLASLSVSHCIHKSMRHCSTPQAVYKTQLQISIVETVAEQRFVSPRLNYLCPQPLNHID